MSVVTPISSARGVVPGESGDAQAVRIVRLSFADNSKQLLEQILRESQLTQDARAIWLAYPQLQSAAEKTVDMLSLAWPYAGDASKSAIVEAIVAALTRVRQGLTQRENTTPMVVRNFLSGLATVADDVMRTQAWGYLGGRPVEQYAHDDWNFVQWAHSGRFDEVRFYAGAEVPRSDLNGARLKYLCNVADSRAVGLVELHKYSL